MELKFKLENEKEVKVYTVKATLGWCIVVDCNGQQVSFNVDDDNVMTNASTVCDFTGNELKRQ